MSLIGTAVTVILGVLLFLIGYAVAAYGVLFYLLADERLGSGLAVDAAYAFTAPFVLSIAWLRTVRSP